MQISLVGVNSLIIYFGNTICEDTSKLVHSAHLLLKELSFTQELTPSYTSILVQIKQNTKDPISKIKDKLKNLKPTNTNDTKLIRLPICYELAQDLERISDICKIKPKDIIELHSSVSYRVYALGFLAGFAYLANVPKQIQAPRLQNPRPKIPAKSLGLADNQTAIYPSPSPGGWNIIGTCPVEMFSLNYSGFSYLQVGQIVQFYPISQKEFNSWKH